MRKLISSLVVIGVLLSSYAMGFAEDKELEGTVTLSGAWAIYPTAVAWAEAFQKIHPKVKIDISAGGAGKGAADAIAGLVDIGMVSRDPDPSELKKDIQAVYILKDAVYPIISDKNFFREDILKKGLNRRAFSEIYISGTKTTWNEILGQKGN